MSPTIHPRCECHDCTQKRGHQLQFHDGYIVERIAAFEEAVSLAHSRIEALEHARAAPEAIPESVSAPVVAKMEPAPQPAPAEPEIPDAVVEAALQAYFEKPGFRNMRVVVADMLRAALAAGLKPKRPEVTPDLGAQMEDAFRAAYDAHIGLAKDAVVMGYNAALDVMFPNPTK